MANRLADNMKERSLPVVLMIDKGMTAERRALAAWLADSRFSSCDAVDMFEVISEMADFTVRDNPDVIVLDTDPCNKNFALMRSILNGQGGSAPEILTLSDQNAKDHEGFVGDLRAVAARLNFLIPERLAH